MRIVAWNLRGATDTKWDLLAGLQPDVAVLPESAQAPLRAGGSLLDPPVEWHWVGRNPTKGLAVAAFPARALAPASGTTPDVGTAAQPIPSGVLVPDAAGRWSVAVRRGRLTVIGVWSCPSDGGYAREVERSIDAHARWLDPDADVVVAGDFNVDAAGAMRRRSGGSRRLHRRLAELGLHSAYHTVRSEPLGAESRATYYHHRNREHRFHIDFCYLSRPLLERVATVEIGAYDDWIAPGHSDHVPVVVDIDDR